MKHHRRHRSWHDVGRCCGALHRSGRRCATEKSESRGVIPQRNAPTEYKELSFSTAASAHLLKGCSTLGNISVTVVPPLAFEKILTFRVKSFAIWRTR